MRKILNNNSRLLAIMLALVMVFGVFAPTMSLAAPADLIGITFEDASAFTIIGQNSIGQEPFTKQVRVQGLTSNYKKVDIDDVENISWEVEEGSNLVSVSPSQESDTATITVNKMRNGYAKVVASYQYNGETLKVHSNVFVEGLVNAPAARNITVKVVNENGKELNFTEVKTIRASDLNNENILKKSPTVIHALVRADQEQGGALNVEIDGNGLVTRIFDLESEEGDNFYKGWTYSVKRGDENIDQPEFGAGVFKLQSGDVITFNYQSFSW